MTNEELAKRFEEGLGRLDETEVRHLLSSKMFGSCADCGKPIFISNGKRRRCDQCQHKRNRANAMEYHKRDYKSIRYQDIVGKKVGR